MKEAEFYQNSKIEILSEFKTCDEIKTPSLPSVEEIEKPSSFGQKESQFLKRWRVDVDEISKELLRQEQKMKLLLQEKENRIAELESRQEELWAQKRIQEKTIREGIRSRKAMKERLKEEANKHSETLIHLCAENAHLKSQERKITAWATNFDLLREEKDKIAEEKESLFTQCSKANDEKALLLDHVKRLNKKIDDVELRHHVECNRSVRRLLRDDVTATVAELKRQRDKHNEDAQKRLAENAEVEQLSDPNRPSEVARRYGDLFQRTYDVVDVLEERDVDEDTCNRFVEMLKISSDVATTKVDEYQRANAKNHGLNDAFLKKNSAQRTLKESVTCLLRLASTARKEENSSCITKAAFEKVKKTETFQKYKSKEITSAIEKFLRQTASVV
ncbi:golgin subfamily A member 6-like protein 4 [Oscarella lobularis]|uniref:golgin subfamily A member 6-like protein 4 n=1 Tax=Oscarella lobularis TaxID=121494 RepID=UPI00331343D9